MAEDNSYKTSEGNFWKPEKKGESVEGLYINKDENVGENNSNIYFIEQLKDNEVIQIWGTTILDNRMRIVKIGQQVKITYEGKAEKGSKGKQAPHLWKVQYKNVETDIEDFAKEEFGD